MCSMGAFPASFGRPVKILVADDHPVIRKMVTTTLKEEPGFDVIGEAENGLQAVEKAGALKPDVVVLNIKMPVLDGCSPHSQESSRGCNSYSFERSG